jgi:DNA-binding MarR family transcriptional regulator
MIGAPMAGQTPAEEAWALLWRIMQANKPRMIEMARELDFSPVQLHSLRVLEPGVETPMRALAQQLFCDPSNVTGIVDRLEARGLIERRSSETDRRVKIIRLTPEGQRVRAQVVARMASPPQEIAELPLEAQLALRDSLRQAADRLDRPALQTA